MNQSFSDEVTARFGVLPNFFCSTPATEELVQQLWQFARAGYLDCPLPSVFKERLFVHLSRFCVVRYCIVRHVGFLIGEGRPAGDASVAPQTVEEVLALLRRPFPDGVQLGKSLERLENIPQPVDVPHSGTPLERDLFDVLTIIFLEPRQSDRARHAITCAMGETRFEILTAFLAFVRTAHFWTETHPTLQYETDMCAVMAEHHELAQLLLDQTEAERVKVGAELRETLAELRESRGERARVEATLRTSEDQLKAALRAARMAFWEWDPANDTVVASDTMDELYGLPSGEKFQTSARGFDLVHPEDFPAHRAKVDGAIRTGGSWHDQFRVTRPCDGKVAWLEERGEAIIDSQTGKLTLTGLVWEVTARKLLEQSLEEADRRKDEFLATLSHELRNPLAPLRNGLQIARLTSKADSPFQHTLAMMDRQMTHLVRLVDDLLDVGRIASGKIELRLKNVNLRDVLTSSADAVRLAIDAHGHELTVETGAEELWINGDFERLTQIFSNLLANAAKYTDSGGKIELRVAREADWAVISVVDNGIGIPTADLAHVFEMFSQVRVHQGRAEGGLGIGLSIVRKLAELHQGVVSASSEGSGKGSVFVVRLPLISSTANASAIAQDVLQLSLPRRRILVVDDNADAADTFAMLLRQLGHEVAVAYGAEEAIGGARDSRPDVIFLDLGMPGMGGLEAARQLRSASGGERIMLVALTGRGLEEDVRRTREAGFDWHLLKPIDPSELNKVLAPSLN